MRNLILTLAAALALTPSANAQTWDPECEPATNPRWDGVEPYDATNGVRFCVPLLDSTGAPVAADYYREAFVTMEQNVVWRKQTPRPGEFVQVPVPSTVPDSGNFSVFVYNVEDEEAVSGPHTATFRIPDLAPPAEPELLP